MVADEADTAAEPTEEVAPVAEGLTPEQLIMKQAYLDTVAKLGKLSATFYSEVSPQAEAGVKCANCSFYEGNGICAIVEGTISPEGVCPYGIIAANLVTDETAPAPVPNEVVVAGGQAVVAFVGKRKQARDGDGDGFVYDNTPMMRPYNPLTDLVGKKVSANTLRLAGNGDRRSIEKIDKAAKNNMTLGRVASSDKLIESTLGKRPEGQAGLRWDRLAGRVRNVYNGESPSASSVMIQRRGTGMETVSPVPEVKLIPRTDGSPMQRRIMVPAKPAPRMQDTLSPPLRIDRTYEGLSAQELQKVMKETGFVFAGADLTDDGNPLGGRYSFAGTDLSGIDFTGANLDGVDFTGAKFNGTNLTSARLSNANLNKADLSGAMLTDTNFESANLADAKLAKTDLRTAVFERARLTNADLSETNARGTNFNGANLSGARAVSADMSNADLTDADISDMDTRGAKLDGAKLDGAKRTQTIENPVSPKFPSPMLVPYITNTLVTLTGEEEYEWDTRKGRFERKDPIGIPDPKRTAAAKKSFEARIKDAPTVVPVIVPKELTDEEKAVLRAPALKVAAERLAILDDVLSNGLETDKYLATDVQEDRRGADGDEWTLERRSLHDRITNDLYAQMEEIGIPRRMEAFILGGLPGSGKSFSLNKDQAAESLKFVVWDPESPPKPGVRYTHVAINSDWFKKRIIEEGGAPDVDGLLPMEMASFLHEESSYLGKKVELDLVENKYNIAFDGTLGSEGSIRKKLAMLQENGYAPPVALFVDIPVKESLTSTENRYLNGVIKPDTLTVTDPVSGKETVSLLGGRLVPSRVQKGQESVMGNMSVNRDTFNWMVAEGQFGSGMTIDNTGVSTPFSPEFQSIKATDRITGVFGGVTELPNPNNPDAVIKVSPWLRQREDLKSPMRDLGPDEVGPRGLPFRSVDSVLKMPGVKSGSGTVEKPFDTDDARTAAILLAEGQYKIKLDQPEEVSVLMEELAVLAKRASDAGREDTLYDLCSVIYNGRSLFCANALETGFARIKMPQLSTARPTVGSMAADKLRTEKGYVDLSEEFIEELKRLGIETSQETISADLLRPSQIALNGGRVAQIRKQIEENREASARRIWISEDNYIIDGHHYWAALVSLNPGETVDIDVSRAQESIIEIRDIAAPWTVAMGSDPQGLDSFAEAVVGV